MIHINASACYLCYLRSCLLCLLPVKVLDLVTPGDVLLTYGHSRSACGALAVAAKKRDAHIFICEGSPG